MTAVHAWQAGTRAISDDLLRAICLHEIGHALGINKHLKNNRSVMYPYCNLELLKLKLHAFDRNLAAEMYDNHPVSPTAVERFIGLKAITAKL